MAKPLGLQNPIVPPVTLGQGQYHPNLQLLSPLGSQPLTVLKPTIFQQKTVSPKLDSSLLSEGLSPQTLSPENLPDQPLSKQSWHQPPSHAESSPLKSSLNSTERQIQRMEATPSEVGSVEEAIPTYQADSSQADLQSGSDESPTFPEFEPATDSKTNGARDDSGSASSFLESPQEGLSKDAITKDASGENNIQAKLSVAPATHPNIQKHISTPEFSHASYGSNVSPLTDTDVIETEDKLSGIQGDGTGSSEHPPTSVKQPAEKSSDQLSDQISLQPQIEENVATPTIASKEQTVQSIQTQTNPSIEPTEHINTDIDTEEISNDIAEGEPSLSAPANLPSQQPPSSPDESASQVSSLKALTTLPATQPTLQRQPESVSEVPLVDGLPTRDISVGQEETLHPPLTSKTDKLSSSETSVSTSPLLESADTSSHLSDNAIQLKPSAKTLSEPSTLSNNPTTELRAGLAPRSPSPEQTTTPEAIEPVASTESETALLKNNQFADTNAERLQPKTHQPLLESSVEFNPTTPLNRDTIVQSKQNNASSTIAQATEHSMVQAARESLPNAPGGMAQGMPALPKALKPIGILKPFEHKALGQTVQPKKESKITEGFLQNSQRSPIQQCNDFTSSEGPLLQRAALDHNQSIVTDNVATDPIKSSLSTGISSAARPIISPADKPSSAQPSTQTSTSSAIEGEWQNLAGLASLSSSLPSSSIATSPVNASTLTAPSSSPNIQSKQAVSPPLNTAPFTNLHPIQAKAAPIQKAKTATTATTASPASSAAPSSASSPPATSPPPDEASSSAAIDKLANRIYQLVRQRLVMTQERQGYSSSRLG